MPRLLNRHHGIPPRDSEYIGRGSPYGNPYIVGVHGNRAEVVALFREKVLPTLDVEPLRGKDLVCFCAPAECHGNPIMEKLYGPRLSDGTTSSS